MGAYDFCQNNPSWKDTPLGFSDYFYLGTYAGEHARAAGCLVTALATVSSYLGHVVNPPQMNQLLKDHGIINSNGDVTVNDSLCHFYSDIDFVERRDWPTQPAPLDYFDVRNDLDTEIIVLIDTSPAQGIQQHWLRVVGFDGNSDILVVDPWDGVRKGLSAYANREGSTVPKIIYAAIKFHKRAPEPPPPSDPPVQPIPPQPPAPEATPPTAPIGEPTIPATPPESAPPAAAQGPTPPVSTEPQISVPPISDVTPPPVISMPTDEDMDIPTLPPVPPKERLLIFQLIVYLWRVLLRSTVKRSKKKL